MKDALTVCTAPAALFSGEIHRKERKHSHKYSHLELKCIEMYKIWESSLGYIHSGNLTSSPGVC